MHLGAQPEAYNAMLSNQTKREAIPCQKSLDTV